MKLKFSLIAALMMTSQMAYAQETPQSLAEKYAAQGYTRIEMQAGPTQIKLEAIRGDEKLELIVDRLTGAILKREVEAVDEDDDTDPGFTVRERDRDFVRIVDEDDEDDDEDDEDEDDDDEDDDDGDDDDGDDEDGDDEDGDDEDDDDDEDGDDEDGDDEDDDEDDDDEDDDDEDDNEGSGKD